VAEGAVKAGRPMPTTVIQYVPCVIRPDRTEARQIVKATLGDMLSAYWAMGEKWPAIRVAMLRGSGIPEEEFVAAVNRIKAGENPTFVLDDRFVDAYSIAGNVDDCLAAMRHFGEIGVTELVVTFVGGQPLVGMANLSSGLKGVA
jgi:hypothetical protein